MTTLIRTRIPLETLSMSQQTTARRRSKRLAGELRSTLCAEMVDGFSAQIQDGMLTQKETYDEEDDGFVFKRGSKRAKTTQAQLEPTPAPAPKSKKSKKTKEIKPRDDEGTATVKKGRGREMSFSTPIEEEADSIMVPKTRKTTRSSLGKNHNGESSNHQSGNGAIDHDKFNLIGASVVGTEEPNVSRLENSNQPTMISLPFSDTPVINRNKELRKKGGSTRRSSLGMRGRRASSLIDNGHSAIPHREVETFEFYKHIEANGLSEPRRMRQLLMWNGERALGEKPSHGDPDSAAALAARVIKESLLKDFSNKSHFSDWFSREESFIPTKIVKKPNPRNEEIKENLAGLEARIQRLKGERDQWLSLSKPQPILPPLFHKNPANLTSSQIDATLLDPEQAAILASISSSSAENVRKQTAERLRTVQSSLEFQVDRFADGVHKVEQYQETAGRVADKILALSAVRLDERDRTEKEEVGTRDIPMQEVLRSLSRILPESGSGSGSG